MIKLNYIAIGNKEEAYLENRFEEGINIIFSNDNNKGKTIISQGIYYALGNVPMFPSSFEYKDYYFLIELLVDNKNILICRKNNTFLTKANDKLSIFNNVSEFKRFFSKNIFVLPKIIKDNAVKIVDPELFIQLFFVGQDARNTANIFNNGYYKKDDFINMIYSLCDCLDITNENDENEIKQKMQTYVERRDLLQKQYEILNKNVSGINLISYTRNKEQIKEKIIKAETLKNTLAKYNSERNKLNNQIIKNEILQKELNSLNKSLDEGQLVCLDCDSKHIGFKNKDEGLVFDVSDIEIRKSIFNVIQERIDTAKEEIEKLDIQIANIQSELKLLMKDEDVSLENILIYKSELLDSDKADKEILDINNELEKLERLLKLIKANNQNNNSKQKNIKEQIIKEMQTVYKEIDPESNVVINDFFSVRGQNYSGCEGSEYYIAKKYTYADFLKHPFPVVIDSFREGELSSDKEDIVLNKFKNLNNQVIFTATLKEEEYSANKYDNYDFVNKIDYSKIETCKLLGKAHLKDFKNILKDLSVKID